MTRTREDVERVFQPWLHWSDTREVLLLWDVVGRELERRRVPIMKVICAWCKKEGKPSALVGEKEPFEDQTESHGLCAEHRRAVEEELAALRHKIAAEAEALQRETEALRRKINTEQQKIVSETESLHRKVDP